MIVLAALAVAAATTAAALPKEFFTEEEVDFMRDAQGLSLRIPAIFKLANIRLTYLGMKEKSRDDRELEKRIAEIRDEIAGKPVSKNPSTEVPGPYLGDFSRVELLRGYIEALEEITGAIDEAYSLKLEVRGVLEQFEKFLSTSVPLLRKFQAHNAAELQAIGDARSSTQEALDSAQDALKKVPKTEKSGRP